MKKILFIGFVACLFLTGSAYAWWSQTAQLKTDQELTISHGVRLVLTDQTAESQGSLVPAGSFQAGKDGYTTSYVFTYKVKINDEFNDEVGLKINLSNVMIGTGDDAIPFDKENEHKGLNIVVKLGDTTVIDAQDDDEEYVVLEAYKEVKELTFTVIITLAPNNTAGLVLADYLALAGKKITFDITFLLI